MLGEFQKDHLEHLLIGLSEVRTKLNSKENVFVEQLENAFHAFGAHTRLSQKQLEWLEGLYKKYVGPLD